MGHFDRGHFDITPFFNSRVEKLIRMFRWPRISFIFLACRTIYEWWIVKVRYAFLGKIDEFEQL